MNEADYGYVAIDIISEDKDSIPYRKSMRALGGSVTATILLQQVIWRARHKGWEPFYKFRSPCNHELYREGDSWTEELGFSIDEFDAAIKRIGTKITTGTSKSEALAGETPTSLVIYWTDTNRITWYYLNRQLLGRLLLPIYLVDRKVPTSLKMGKSNTPVIPKNTTKTTSKTNNKEGGTRVDHSLTAQVEPPPPASVSSADNSFSVNGENAKAETATAEKQQPEPPPPSKVALKVSAPIVADDPPSRIQAGVVDPDPHAKRKRPTEFDPRLLGADGLIEPGKGVTLWEIWRESFAFDPAPAQRRWMKENIKEPDRWRTITAECALRGFQTFKNVRDVYEKGFEDRRNGYAKPNRQPARNGTEPADAASRAAAIIAERPEMAAYAEFV